MTLLLYIADGYFGLLGAAILLGSVQNKRLGLLLPAASYCVSGVMSFALGSWWPLFFGYALVRLFAAFQVGVDPKPVQRPSSVGIFVNHALHVWAGVIGWEVFSLSVKGFLCAALLAVIVQGLDAVGFYHTYTLLLANSPKALAQLPYKVAQLFAMKFVWYGLVTILTAMVVRSFV